MFRSILSGSVFSVALALILLSQPISSSAQCPGVCGDLNGDSLAVSADILALLDWVHQAIPPPGTPECGDVDSYEGLTLRDPIVWMRCVPKATSSVTGCEELSFDCINPPFGPYVPSPSNDYQIIHNDIFPAGDSVVTLRLRLRNNQPLLGFTAPLGVTVNGKTPEFSDLDTGLEHFWFYEGGRYDVPGAQAGHLLLGFSVFAGRVDSGYYQLAQVDLQLPPAMIDRTITLEWFDIVPDSTHMAVDPSLDGWELSLVPCHITIPGDVNANGHVNSADIIWLINHLFKGGPEPVLCPAVGDANCSGSLTSADAIRIVNYIFLFREAPCGVCALVADGVWDCP